MICKKHNKITYLTICSRCIVEIKQLAKKEVFDDIEKELRPLFQKEKIDFIEELKIKHLSNGN